MRALTSKLLLAAWDNAASEHELDRALTLLSLSMPESSREQLAALSIAERNLLLLRLRALSFGSILRGFTPCLHCGTRLEFTLSLALMLSDLETRTPRTSLAWTEEDNSYLLRPVNSNDLLALLHVTDADAAADSLLARCLRINGEEQESSLACSTQRDLTQRFETLNAAAEIECVIDCPACSARDTFDLDIVRFLWLEVRHAAQRLLTEIHELASAYGWSEHSIASMSPRRRNAYMGMLSA